MIFCTITSEWICFKLKGHFFKLLSGRGTKKKSPQTVGQTVHHPITGGKKTILTFDSTAECSSLGELYEPKSSEEFPTTSGIEECRIDNYCKSFEQFIIISFHNFKVHQPI